MQLYWCVCDVHVSNVCVSDSYSVCVCVFVHDSHRAAHLQQYLVLVKVTVPTFPGPHLYHPDLLMDELIIRTDS